MKKIFLLFFTIYCLFGYQTVSAGVLVPDGPTYICRCSATMTFFNKSDGRRVSVQQDRIFQESEIDSRYKNIQGCILKYKEVYAVEFEKQEMREVFCSYEPQLEMTELIDDFKLTAPELKVKIPGFDNFSLPPTQWDQEGNVYLPWIGEYVKAIYNFSLIVISILAVLMIIISGIKIIFSGLGGDRQEAYKRIQQAIFGLLLAWGSYTILFLINPNLLKLQNLSIQLVLPVDIPEDIMAEVPQNEKAEVPPSDLIRLDGFTKFFVTPDTNNAFKNVKKEIKNIGVNAAYRSPGQQYSLMVSYCGCPPKPPLNADKQYWDTNCTKIPCSAGLIVEIKDGIMKAPKVSHLSGQAIDAQISDKPSTIPCKESIDPNVTSSEGIAKFSRKGTEINAGYCISKDQQLLIKAMLNNGFCVLLGESKNLREPWHFQYQLFNSNCVGKEHKNIKKLYYVQNES